MDKKLNYYENVVCTSGIYPIQEHLMALKSGYKPKHTSFYLRDNLNDLKYNRNADAQNLIDKLILETPINETINNVKLIDELLDMVTSDKVINNTSHTFEEFFNE